MASPLLSLALALCLALASLPSIDSQTCSRVVYDKNVLVVLLDGVRADIVQNNYQKLPNFKSLSTNGVSAECPSWDEPSCAKTSLGARYSSFPISPDQLGPQNRSSSEIGPYLGMYHWFGFNGYASVITGLDTNVLQMTGEDSNSASSFTQLMRSRDGTFFKQAYDAGNIVAVTGSPPLLTSDFLNIDYKTNTYGVLDFECGITIGGSPNVIPSASSSCNTNFRYSVPNNLYSVLGDTPSVNYALNIINGGCANVVAVHLKDPDTAMHNFGLSSTQYMDSLVSTDSRIGSLLDAVDSHSTTYSTDWLVIVTADHGGVETADAPYVYNVNTNSLERMDHDMNWGPDEAVPFIVNHYSSPNVNVSLTNFTGSPHNFDVTPTILSYLEIESSDFYDGVVQGIVVPQVSSAERIVQSFLVLFCLLGTFLF